MVSLNFPFTKASQKDRIYSNLVINRPELFWSIFERNNPAGFFSNTFKDLVTRMLAYNPEERIPLDEIIAHPWMNEDVPTYEQIHLEFQQRYAKVFEEKKQSKERRD